MKRRLLGLMTIGNQTTEDINSEIDRTAMARMLDLGNIFELVNDSFNNPCVYEIKACQSDASNDSSYCVEARH